MEYIQKIDKIPDGEYYIALVQKTTHIPEDERSRTNPGHGYPATTEYSFEMIQFKDENEMADWVAKEESRKYGVVTPYKILRVKAPRITTKVVVDVRDIA